MKVFAKFDEIPLTSLQDIKKTKRYGHTFVRSDGRTDNVKTVYPPTNTVCGGINMLLLTSKWHFTVINIFHCLNQGKCVIIYYCLAIMHVRSN